MSRGILDEASTGLLDEGGAAVLDEGGAIAQVAGSSTGWSVTEPMQSVPAGVT